MPKFLLKDGKFAAKNGKLVAVEDPADCDCCGPPTPITCERVAEIKVEWGGMGVVRVENQPLGLDQCFGEFTNCFTGGEGQFPQGVNLRKCEFFSPGWDGFPSRKLVTFSISTRGFLSGGGQIPRCVSYANKPDQIEGQIWTEIIISDTLSNFFTIGWEIGSDLKEGEIPVTKIFERDRLGTNGVPPDCKQAIQEARDEEPKITVTLKNRRRALPPPMENPFP